MDLLAISLEAVSQRVKACIEEFMTTPNVVKARVLDHTVEKAMSMKVFEKADTMNTDNDAVVIHDKLVLKNLRTIINTSIVDKYTKELQNCKDITEVVSLCSSTFFPSYQNIISEGQDQCLHATLAIFYQHSAPHFKLKSLTFSMFFELLIDAITLTDSLFSQLMHHLFVGFLENKDQKTVIFQHVLLFFYYNKPSYQINLLCRNYFEEYADTNVLGDLLCKSSGEMIATLKSGSFQTEQIDEHFRCFEKYYLLCSKIGGPLARSERHWFIHTFMKQRCRNFVKLIWFVIAKDGSRSRNHVKSSGVYEEPLNLRFWKDQVTVSIILKYYHGKFLNGFGEAWLEFFDLKNVNPANFMDTSMKILVDIRADQNPYLETFHSDQYSVLTEQLTNTLKYNEIDSSKAKIKEQLTTIFLETLFDLCNGRENFYKKFLKYCHSNQSEKLCKDNYTLLLSHFAEIAQHLGDPFYTFYYENYLFKLAIRDNNPDILKIQSEGPFSVRNESTENDFTLFVLLTISIKAQFPLNERHARYLEKCDDFQNWALSHDNRVLCLNTHRDTFPKSILQNHDENLEKCLPPEHPVTLLTEIANKAWSSQYNAQNKRSVTKMYELSHGVIGTPYRLPNTEFLNLHVNFFQYMILDCYQEQDELSLEDLLQKTNLQLKDVVPALQSFMKINMVKQTGRDKKTFFALNLEPGTLKISMQFLQKGNVLKLPYRVQLIVSRGASTGDATNKSKRLKKK